MKQPNAAHPDWPVEMIMKRKGIKKGTNEEEGEGLRNGQRGRNQKRRKGT